MDELKRYGVIGVCGLTLGVAAVALGVQLRHSPDSDLLYLLLIVGGGFLLVVFFGWLIVVYKTMEILS